MAKGGDVGGQARQPEEHRHEERHDEAAQLLLDVACQDGRLADQNARHEGAEHGLHTDRIRRQRHRSHDHQDDGDHGQLAHEVIVGPADHVENEPASHREG